MLATLAVGAALLFHLNAVAAAPARIFWQASGSLFAIDAAFNAPFESIKSNIGYIKNDFLGPVASADNTELFWMSSSTGNSNSVSTFWRYDIASDTATRIGYGCWANLASFEKCILLGAGSVPTGALAHDADNDRLLCYLDSGKLLGVALSGTAKDEEPVTLTTFKTSEHEFSGPFIWFEDEWWVVDLKVGIVSLHPTTWAVTTRVEIEIPGYLTGFDILKSQRVVVFSKAATADTRPTESKGLWRYDLDSGELTLLERWLQADSYYGALLDQERGFVHTIMSIPYTRDSAFFVRRPHLRTDHRGRLDANAEAHSSDRRDFGQRWMVHIPGDLTLPVPVPVTNRAGSGGRGYHSLGRSQDGWFHDYYSSDFSQYTSRPLIDSVSIITQPELDKENGWAYYVHHYRMMRRAYQTDNSEEILWDVLDQERVSGKVQAIHQFEDKFSFGMSSGWDERRGVFYYVGSQPRLESLNSWVPYLGLYCFQPGVDVFPWLRYVFLDDGPADWQGGRLVFVQGETPEQDSFLAPNFDEGVWKITGLDSFTEPMTKSLLFPRSGTGSNQLSYGIALVGDKAYYPEDDFLYELDMNNLPSSSSSSTGKYKEIASVFHRPPPTTTVTTYEAYGVVYNEPTNTLTLSHRTGLGDNYLSLFSIEKQQFIGPPHPLGQPDPEGGTVPRASSFLKYITVHPADFDPDATATTTAPVPTSTSSTNGGNNNNSNDATTSSNAKPAGQCSKDEDCPGEQSFCKSDLTCLLADGYCFDDTDCKQTGAICKSDNTCFVVGGGAGSVEPAAPDSEPGSDAANAPDADASDNSTPLVEANDESDSATSISFGVAALVVVVVASNA